jgi:hypothetical protein
MTIGFDGRLYFDDAGVTSEVCTQAPALPTTLQPDIRLFANPTTGDKLDGMFLADMNSDGILDTGDRLYYTGPTSGLYCSVFTSPATVSGDPALTGTWSTPVIMANPAGANVIGLAGEILSPTHVVLFATQYNKGSTATSLLKFDDTNANSPPMTGGSFTTLVSTAAPTGGFGYRGVSFAPLAPTVITLTPSTYSTTPGGQVTFMATVTNASAGTSLVGANVEFIDNNNTLLATKQIQPGGTVSFTTTVLPAGENDIKVYFAADNTNNYAQGLSNTVVVEVVGPNTPTVSLGASPNPSTLNQSVAFTFQASGGAGTPSGRVTFTADGSVGLGTFPLDNTGKATLNYAGLSVGSHTLTAHYSGDANYQVADATLSPQQVVHPGATITVASSAQTTTPSTPVTFTATVNGNGTDPAPTGTVTFYSDGTAIPSGTVNLSGNSAQLPNITLTAGSHLITATFNGDTHYAAVTSYPLIQNMKQAFAQGDLLVLRMGDPLTVSLGSQAIQLYVDEYTPAGALVQSVAMPNVDTGTQHMLTLSGSAQASGTLATSADGHYVTLVGIDATPGTPVVTLSPSNTVPRAVARLDSNSVLDTSTALTIPSGNAFGSVIGAVSNDGKEFWVGGDSGATDAGLQYATIGTVGTPTPIGPNNVGARSPGIFNSQLYASAGSTNPMVQVGTGLPTSQTTFTGLTGITSAANGIQDPFQFLFFSTGSQGANVPDLLYVADLQQGVLKFYFDGTKWNYISAKRDYAGGATGITGTRDPSTGIVTLYGTGSKTAQGAFATNLFTFQDTGGLTAAFPSGSPTELATVAGPGSVKAFRGIAFVPTPQAPTIANVQVNDGSAQRSEVRSISVTFSGPVTFNGSPAAAFQLQHVQDSTNVANLQTSVSLNNAGQTVVKLTFTTNGNAATEVDPVSIQFNSNPIDGPSLADGRFQLTVFSANVSGGGFNLAGGGPSGNYVSGPDSFNGNGPKLYRLYGDATGDGVNDPSDLIFFRSTFNVNNTQAAYLAYLDANNDGVVDPSDLNEYRTRFNRNVF